MINIEKKAVEYAKRYLDRTASLIAEAAYIVGATGYREQLKKAEEIINELKEAAHFTVSNAWDALNE